MERPVSLPAALSSGTDDCVVATVPGLLTRDRFVPGVTPLIPEPSWKFQSVKGVHASCGGASSFSGEIAWPPE